MGIGPIDSQVLAESERAVTELFHCGVQRSRPIEIPAGSLDARRRQYSSVAFMASLARGRFEGADRVIGITECDLFIPMLTFVFGQAQLNGRVALVSIARLRQEFYGAPSDPGLVGMRLMKEIGHELGHSFGLIHCPDRGCLMSLATSIQEVDRKNSNFCGSCCNTDFSLSCGDGLQAVPPAQPALKIFARATETEEKNENQMADSGRR